MGGMFLCQIEAINPTKGRAYHGLINSGVNVVAFSGVVKGCGSVCITNDVLLFDTVKQQWFNVFVPTNASVPPRFKAGFIINPNTKVPTVIGGISIRASLFDNYEMQPVSFNGKMYTTTFRPLISDIGSLDKRIFIRGAASVTGLSSHFIVCGGLISALVGANRDDQCYEYNSKTGKSTLLPPLIHSISDSQAVYISNKVVVFGGQGPNLCPTLN